MPEIELPNGWEPRPYQLAAWTAWERGLKRLLLIWHRRAGKDDVALHMAAVAAHERVANYWHMLPEYAQARKAIWESVNPHTGRLRIDQAFPKELRASTRNDEMAITFKNGSSWRVVGSDRPDSLVGAAPAGIVFSEFALSNPTTWALLAPILEENGGWAAFITTPRGRNHVHSMLAMAERNPTTWFAEVLPASKTGIISTERIERQREEYTGLYGDEAADALIDQEYHCSFEAAILGAYYGKIIRTLEVAGHVTGVDIEPDLPVHRAWDLGIGDSTAIWWFQVVGHEVRVVDWHEANGVGIPHYAALIHAKGYPKGRDYVPHDARVRELGTGKTRVETMLELGLNPTVVASHKVDDGINAVRQTLPRCWFDFERTRGGLERLRQYKRTWDDGKKVFSDTPCHDFCSHSADAFRYLAMAWRELAPTERPKTMKEKIAEVIRPRTLDEMLADADAEREEW